MPSGGTEIFAMHQHNGLTCGLGRLVIQIRHLHGLALRNECVMQHRRGVFKALQLGSVDRRIGLS